jgi:hypothetical protein
VIFKALATRDRDVEDAASVLRRSPELLDFTFLEAEIGLLSGEIADWDVRGRWDLILARTRLP